MADVAWPPGVASHVLREVDSTNAHALRLAPDLDGPAWFVGLTQTAGKGRRARAWSSPLGNFHATLLTFPREDTQTVALRSFAAALALRDALIAVTRLPQSYTLKWPNDVLLNGKKVAGILLESTGSGARIHHLAVGIGVNLVAAPKAEMLEPGALQAASVLVETGLRIEPEAFLRALAPAFAKWEHTLITEGFAPLRAEWLTHAARLGEIITARTAKATFQGRFETIDLHGNLMLRTPNDLLAIPAADVFF